jgi:DNA-binding MarR family transcriptional regulator
MPLMAPTPSMPSTTRAATATPELAGRLRLAIARLARQLRQTSEGDLTPTQLSLLATLDTGGPMTLGELAERERVAPPSITKAVSKLVDRRLVDRTTDADDRRIARVTLTGEGRTLLERNRCRRNAWLAKRLQELDDDQLARLAAATDVLEHLAGVQVEALAPPDEVAG